VARRQTQLMWQIIYDGSVLSHTREPLEWFPFDTPDPHVQFHHARPQARCHEVCLRAGSSRVNVTCILRLTIGPQLPAVFPPACLLTDGLKGKCALGPFLSILVIECQHKCLNVNSCLWMNKVKIKSKGMFLSLSTLVLCTNILV
jgi:hypothetical protein